MKRNISVILTCFLWVMLLAGCAEAEPSLTTLPTTQPVEQEETTVPTTEAPTEPEPEPPAQIIEEGVKVLVAGRNCTSIVSDGSHYSRYNIHEDEDFVIESEIPFEAIYIQWNGIPGEYVIRWEGGSCPGGEYDFLHEYIRLPEAVTRVEICLEGEATRQICEVTVMTAGSAPEGVQVWLPPCEEADILVFPTHSDDDALFFGPVIAYYSIEKGLKVQTAFMVKHTSFPERDHERLNGLWTMGVRYYPILGNAPDTANHSFYESMAYYKSSNIEQWQVEQIRRFRPLVVVGHDLNGEYGNGGHKVNAYFLVQAIESASNPEMFPESAEQYGLWDTPKFYLHLYEENEILMDVETPLENDPQGRNLYEICVDAFACHVSQRSYFKVSYGGNRKYDCRPFGLYRTLVGYDTKADIMDNIDPEMWRNQD